MKLLLIRHAEAEPKSAGKKDDARKLTADGIADAKQARPGILNALGDEEKALVAVSPTVRTVETAKLIFQRSGHKVQTVPQIGEHHDVKLQWLRKLPNQNGTVVLVGHGPKLRKLMGVLVGKQFRKKGTIARAGAALLDVPAGCRAGSATLEWTKKPSELDE